MLSVVPRAMQPRVWTLELAPRVVVGWLEHRTDGTWVACHRSAECRCVWQTPRLTTKAEAIERFNRHLGLERHS